jgi:hypothetical protein
MAALILLRLNCAYRLTMPCGLSPTVLGPAQSLIQGTWGKYATTNLHPPPVKNVWDYTSIAYTSLRCLIKRHLQLHRLRPDRLWGPTQPPVQWVPRGSFPGGKGRPGRDADHSPPSSAEFEKEQELYLLSPQPPPPPMACDGSTLLSLY